MRGFYAVLIAAIVFAFVLSTGSRAFAEGTPVNTSIAVTGSATWDGGGVDSNPVTTTVAAAYGMRNLVRVTSDQAANAGETVTYTFTVVNFANTSDTLVGSVVDVATPAGWTVTPSAPVSVNVDTLGTLTVDVFIPADAVGGAECSFRFVVRNSAVDGEDGWPISGNDVLTSTLATTRVYATTLTLSMETSSITAKPYETITYTMTYTNTGSAAATNVSLTIPVPGFTTYVGGSAVGAGATIEEVGTPVTSVTFGFDSIGSGVTGTVSIRVRID